MDAPIPHSKHRDKTREVTVRHIHHITEHIAEERTDHAQEHGIVKNIRPAAVFGTQLDHAALNALCQQRDQNQANHDSHRHDSSHRYIIRGRGNGGICVQTQLGQGCTGCDRLIGQGAYHRQPQPGQRDAKTFA